MVPNISLDSSESLLARLVEDRSWAADGLVPLGRGAARDVVQRLE